jgi:hypothetical protein
MDASAAAIQANLKHITKFEVKLSPQPLSETAVTEAFGAWAYPKIVSASAAVPAQLAQAGMLCVWYWALGCCSEMPSRKVWQTFSHCLVSTRHAAGPDSNQLATCTIPSAAAHRLLA